MGSSFALTEGCPELQNQTQQPLWSGVVGNLPGPTTQDHRIPAFLYNFSWKEWGRGGCTHRLSMVCPISLKGNFNVPLTWIHKPFLSFCAFGPSWSFRHLARFIWPLCPPRVCRKQGRSRLWLQSLRSYWTESMGRHRHVSNHPVYVRHGRDKSIKPALTLG